MSHPLHLAWAEVTVFCHSTESEAKVKKALMNIFPVETAETLTISTQYLRGHYTDKITVINTALKKEADALLSHIIKSLSSLDRTSLLDELESRTDGSGNLYLRLNKQQAFLGHIELSDSDPIRIKLKLKATGRHVSTRYIEEALNELAEEQQTKEDETEE